MEGRADESDPFSQFVDEQASWVIIVPAPPLDGVDDFPEVLLWLFDKIAGERLQIGVGFTGLEVPLERRVVNEGERVNAYLAREYELDSSQPNAFHRELRVDQ